MEEKKGDTQKGPDLSGLAGYIVSAVIWVPIFVFVMVQVGETSLSDLPILAQFFAFVAVVGTAQLLNRLGRADEEKEPSADT